MGPTRHRSALVKPIAGLLVVAALCLGFAAQALATTRFAVSGGGGGDGNCSTKAALCSIQAAHDAATDGDTLIISHGAYDFGANSGPTINKELTVKGEDGEPPPALTSNKSDGYTLLVAGGNGLSVSHLRISQLGPSNALGLVAFGTSGRPLLEIIIANTTGAGATSIALVGPVALRDSTADTGGGDARSISVSGDGIIRNVTAANGGGNGIALLVNPACFVGCSADSNVVVANSILLNEGGGGFDVKTTSGNSFDGTHTYYAHAVLDFSNYANVSNCAGGCTLTPPGSASNQVAPPKLVDTLNADFHELSGSPTIDAGQDSADNGSTDPDGNARKLGAAPDIGAYEFVPPGSPAVTPNPPAPPPGGPPGILLQFRGLTFSLNVLKVKGKVVVIPLACPAGAQGNCAGNLTIVTASKVLVPKKATVAAKRKKKKLTLGKASFSIPPGQTKNVRVKLSKSALKLLASKGSVKSVVNVRATVNGIPTATTKKVTVKGKKKKRR